MMASRFSVGFDESVTGPRERDFITCIFPAVSSFLFLLTVVVVELVPLNDNNAVPPPILHQPSGCVQVTNINADDGFFILDS
ncbi:hypothetical protein CPB83DRAFT_842483 [Crepidotus variabilis]|uniref:Uncharacterized protein n=1 Tax=Crepidotus variabilis TaxID=179855 RepID=A0A9P6JWL9_9AGAR|nr:hypothetical protein CPB83DRAFT_842483 [Crepidotus variabilis]